MEGFGARSLTLSLLQVAGLEDKVAELTALFTAEYEVKRLSYVCVLTEKVVTWLSSIVVKQYFVMTSGVFPLGKLSR